MEADGAEDRREDGEPGAGADAWAVVSRVNADLRYVDDIAFGDDRDDFVAQVNLHGNAIESMDGLETFTRVVELCLSSNCIEEVSFHALEPLVSLRVLDLSANSIESTLGFPQLPSLEELSMAHNRLQRLDGMTRPIKFPRLRYLDLRGNEIGEFNGVVALQRFKRLAQLRLQAQDGSMANPVCDLDDYQDTMIRMLPTLKFLDEEEVDLLKEVGSIRMPKYRSILRRIASSNSVNSSHNNLGGTSASPTRSESSSTLVVKGRDSPETRQRDQASFKAYSPARAPRRQNSSQLRSNQLRMGDESKQVPDVALKSPAKVFMARASPASTPKKDRIVLKESETNTDPYPIEEELAKREQDIAQREARLYEAERGFLARGKQLVDAQKGLEEQVAELTEKLKQSAARTTEDQDSLAELTSQLEAERKEHAHAQGSYEAAVSELNRSLLSKDGEWEAKVTDLTSRHYKELRAVTAAKGDVERALAGVEARVLALTQQMHTLEDELKTKEAAWIKQEEAIALLTAEVERRGAANSSLESQRLNESKGYKERLEDSAKRTNHLEKQVAELQLNLETVYNKCVEKDEDCHQLKRSLLAKQMEVDELKTQHAKAMDRQDKLLLQQQTLYDKQLQASVLQIEMEFRKEHQLTAQQFQDLQRRYHDAIKEIRRLQDAYGSSRRREASARAEISKIQAILADDKQKLYAEDAKRTDEFEHRLHVSEDRCIDLEKQIEVLRTDNERIGTLEQQVKNMETHADELKSEVYRLTEQQETWRKQEDNLRAALKVKDVMLNDQLRQLSEMRREREELEERFNDEMAELQGHVEELEAALDDSAQLAMDGEAKCEALQLEKQELGRQMAALSEQLDEQANNLEQKRTALDFIEQEIEKMRSALSNQDEMFQKRLKKRVEQHSEELERAHAAGEEERERLRIELEAQQREMMSKYQSLSIELQGVVAQNTKLRVALEQERKKIAQNDHDMRVLIAQIDRERHMKQEHLRQIKSLFEQLQRDVP